MSTMQDAQKDVARTMASLNRSWLEGRLDDLSGYFHPHIAMALPGFSGTAVGAGAVLEGFKDVVQSAIVNSFENGEPDIHVVGPSAVVSYPFDVVFTRAEQRYRSTGRDLWVFSWMDGSWKAIWRTMLDLHDQPIEADSGSA